MRIPVDLFQLYLALGVVTNRFGVLLTTMNVLMLTLLGTCAVCRLLTPQWGRLLRNAVLTVVIVALSIGGARTFFTLVLDNEYRKDEIIAGMQLLRTRVSATVHTQPPLSPLPPREAQLSPLERIRA